MKILDLFKRKKPKEESDFWIDTEMRAQNAKVSEFVKTSSKELSDRFKRLVVVQRTDHLDDYDFYTVGVTVHENDDDILMRKILRKPILLSFEKLGTRNEIEDVRIKDDVLEFFIVAYFN